jgi:c-di-AMP phosphodiesterase-like protein
VVKQGTKLYFYGGKSQGVEKRSKVKSRVIANALRDLIEHSEQIFIMSHEGPDLDSIGAALGIFRCAKFAGKDARIVLNKSNASVDSLIRKLQKNEVYNGLFIRTEDALNRLSKNTLVVVVDTHRPSFTEAPELIERAERVVVFDHHRRGLESIENATLSYLEPYASSASELITEKSFNTLMIRSKSSLWKPMRYLPESPWIPRTLSSRPVYEPLRQPPICAGQGPILHRFGNCSRMIWIPLPADLIP